MPKMANAIGHVGLTLATGSLAIGLGLLVGASAQTDHALTDKSVENKSIVPPPRHGPDYFAPPPVVPVS